MSVTTYHMEAVLSGIWIESPSFKDKVKVLHLSQPSGRANVAKIELGIMSNMRGNLRKNIKDL
ncbi:hypothetical protein AAG906_038716 [Vitis piasezkii]